MDKGPLVSEVIDAGARFLAEFNKVIPVRVAFWAKESEGGHWFLYIASDQITDENFDRAYGEVVRIARRMKDPEFDTFQVKVVNSEKPLVKAVLEIQSRSPGRRHAHFGGRAFDWVSVEEVYIYPQFAPTAGP